MKLKMTEFGAPKGIYLAKFLGLKAFETAKVGRDGKPMEPGMEWQFEIIEDTDHDGAYVGVRVGRITSQTPTAGNACGQLLGGLVDRKIDLNEEIDPDAFTGQLYRVTIAGQRDNPEKTQVIQIDRWRKVAVPAANGPPPRPGTTIRPPPPRPVNPPVLRYWIETGQGDPTLMATHEVNAYLAEHKLAPATVAACQENTDAWKTLADYGFKDTAPF